MSNNDNFARRGFLKGSAAFAGAAAVGTLLPSAMALAQQAKLKVGLMLPYTGTFAQLGVAITNGFKLAVDERGGKLGGREIEFVTVDDESNPPRRRKTSTSWCSATRSMWSSAPCTPAW
jgi:branched-chain amino acid transport system substrate-binding protein